MTAIHNCIIVFVINRLMGDYHEAHRVHFRRAFLIAASSVFALPGGAGAAFAEEASTTYVFMCPGQIEYVVRADETQAWVFRPSGSLRLPATSATEPGNYSDGKFELRIMGEQAQLGSTGSQLQDCHNDRRHAIWEKAKLDGADFRAIGNEPPWVLEIQQQSRVVLVTDYGAKRIELPLTSPREDRDARTMRWNGDEFQLEIIGHPCSDSMSGEAFEATVIVNWHGQTLRGCGRALH
jgi:putative lipoprotein